MVTSQSLLGKRYVLYFYPKAMTPGCTVQACGIRDGKSTLAKKKITIFGVSPDKPERLLKFIEKEGLNFDLLSDPDHKLAAGFGVWGKKVFMGKEVIGILRTTFIIDAKGMIENVIEKVNTKSHLEDLLLLL